jgi:uncharacterized membrane protein YbhN (UPF0104 family)
MAEWLKRAIYCLFAAAALFWVLHDVHPADLLRHMAIPHAAWLLLAIPADFLGYLMQGVRWRLFLRPLGNLRTGKAAQAVYAGLFVNEIVPMRFGEVVRAYLASRWLSVRFTSVLPSILFERLADGLWLGAGVCLAALFVPLPAFMIKGSEIFGTILLVSIAILILTAWFGRGKKSGRVGKAAQAIHAAGSAPTFWLAFLTSSALLLMAAMAFWFVMKAYGLPLSFWACAGVFLIVRLGTAIPNAPANVGTFQFFVVAGLMFFGIDKATAAAFSVAVFMIQTIPLWIVGWIALSRTGFTLAQIRFGHTLPSPAEEAAG